MNIPETKKALMALDDDSFLTRINALYDIDPETFEDDFKDAAEITERWANLCAAKIRRIA